MQLEQRVRRQLGDELVDEARDLRWVTTVTGGLGLEIGGVTYTIADDLLVRLDVTDDGNTRGTIYSDEGDELAEAEVVPIPGADKASLN